MSLKKFLDKYDTVIFDMDGVITSEDNYWNCAALTVWETLKRERGLTIDAKECMAKLAEIRNTVFCNDALITALKGRGVNSNWDLGYVTILLAWIVCGKDNAPDFKAVLEYAESMGANIIDEYDNIAKKCAETTGFEYEYLKRNGELWLDMRQVFQQWFLGDTLYIKTYGDEPQFKGKSGLLFKEEPIVDKGKLNELLRLLSESKRVCTGTGRPYIEMIQPLKDWDMLKYFAKDGLSNYDHVAAAEKSLKNNALTKPHPYMFLKALYGTDYADERLVNGDYDSAKIAKALVVGDAGADILAAKAMGADFCAVLTGIQGEKGRAYFEENGAEYILRDVTEFLEV